MLDVATGPGYAAAAAAARGATVVGIDSAPMVDRARKLNPTVAFQKGDAEALPFPDGSFDLVTTVCVYHHVGPTARGRLSSEIARVLRRGGVACIIEHNPFNPVTTIRYSVPEACFVTLTLYNVLGEPVMTLVNRSQGAGEYECELDAGSLVSGVYFCKLQAGAHTDAKKIVVLK